MQKEKSNISDDSKDLVFHNMIYDQALDLLQSELENQVAHGYNAEHDDARVIGELAIASAIYALPEYTREYDGDGSDSISSSWPLKKESFKPSPDTLDGRIRDMTKSLGLGFAELERLLRLKHKERSNED